MHLINVVDERVADVATGPGAVFMGLHGEELFRHFAKQGSRGCFSSGTGDADDCAGGSVFKEYLRIIA